MNKIKMLFYGDSPTVATGFGSVSRGILTNLHATGKYDITILGVNHWGDPHSYEFPIWPVGVGSRDPYGRQRAADMMAHDDFKFDLLFMIQDSFILEFMPQVLPKLRNLKRFKSIVYFPVDGVPKTTWVNAMNCFDQPVTYTEFAKKECILACPAVANRIKAIPHGVNVEDFYPIPQLDVDDFKKQYFGQHASKFIITNVNRNQQRKDIPRTMLAFREFKKRRPNSVLYLHMAAKDQGWDLPEVARSMGLRIGEDVLMPSSEFGPNKGYPLPIVNFIYNCSDVVMSTTLGEGWGLSSTEAMACRRPVVFPNNTSLTEIIGENEERGYLVPSGSTPNDHVVLPNDNEVVRPTTNTVDLAEKLIHVYDNREEAMQKAAAGYSWVKDNLRWDKNIAPQWDRLFMDQLVSLAKEVSAPQVVSAEDL